MKYAKVQITECWYSMELKKTVPLKVLLLQELVFCSHKSPMSPPTSVTTETDRFCSAARLQQVLERRQTVGTRTTHREVGERERGLKRRVGRRRGGRE